MLRIATTSWAILLFTALGSTTLFAQDETTADLDAVLQESSSLLEEGAIEPAIELLENHQSDYPDSNELQNNLAVAYFGVGRIEEAIAKLEELAGEGPVFEILAGNRRQMEDARGDDQPRMDPVLFVRTVDASATAQQAVAATSGAAPEADVPLSGEVDRPAVRAMIESWAEAWSNKAIQTYLGFYAEDFTPRSRTPEAWVDFRHEMLSKPGNISLALSDFDISIGDNAIRARFDQRYDSYDYGDSIRKLLVLGPRDGGWKILREATLEVYDRWYPEP